MKNFLLRLNILSGNKAVGLPLITYTALPLLFLACSMEHDTLITKFPCVRETEVPSPFLGINIHWDYEDIEQLSAVMSDLNSLGVRMVRMDWEWRQVEASRGTYNWSRMDKLMTLADNYGIDVFPMVLYAPDWAVAGSLNHAAGHYAEPPLPEYYRDYADFVVASIKRYGPGGNASIAFRPIYHWEIWNEPNSDHFWSPRQDHREYISLLKTVAQSVRLHSPEVFLVHGGLATADYLWLANCYEPDAGGDPDYGAYFDILSVHPYFIDIETGPRSPDAMDIMRQEPIDEVLSAMGFVGDHRDPGYLGKLYNLRNLMHLQDRCPDKPIWITEVGFFTGENLPAISCMQHAELMQETVEYIAEHFRDTPYGSQPLALNVRKVFWFNYQDYGDEFLPGTWGLVDSSGNRKPGYDQFAELLQQLSP